MIPHSVGKCHEVTKGTGARQAGDHEVGEGEKKGLYKILNFRLF